MTAQEMFESGLDYKDSGKWGLLPDARSLARNKRFNDQASQNAILAVA